jgi:Sialic acid synthase
MPNAKTPCPPIFMSERAIGPGIPCFIIAEMGLGHDGSLGSAHAFIDSATKSGADAVKFQAHIAEAEGTPEEQFRVKVFPQDTTRQDYWRRTAFTLEQWVGLERHATDKGLTFLCSPFSLEAVDMLSRVGVPAWKVGSGETNNLPFLESLARTGLPVLLSTGMSFMHEVDASVALLWKCGAPFMLFQCTNKYPCPPESLGLNLITVYTERYGVPVGFSDHSGRVATGLAAAILGACALEVHVTWHRECFGPDVPASLTFEELGRLVQDLRFVENAMAHPVDKDCEAEALQPVRDMFTKSIVAACNLGPGTVLAEEHLAFKKPGKGIPAARYHELIGRTLGAPVACNEMITADHLAREPC